MEIIMDTYYDYTVGINHDEIPTLCFWYIIESFISIDEHGTHEVIMDDLATHGKFPSFSDAQKEALRLRELDKGL
jgi:hypothetical protein